MNDQSRTSGNNEAQMLDYLLRKRRGDKSSKSSKSLRRKKGSKKESDTGSKAETITFDENLSYSRTLNSWISLHNQWFGKNRLDFKIFCSMIFTPSKPIEIHVSKSLLRFLVPTNPSRSSNPLLAGSFKSFG